MLSVIREKTQGWIAGIILGLLAIPFALWGINYYFDGGSVKVAEVGGVEIGVDLYRKKLDDQKRALQQMLGRSADPRLFESAEFRQRVLDSLVDEVLLAKDIEAQGYRVSNAELVRQIRSERQFQRDGQFDPKLYEVLLRTAGMDARSFENRLRKEVLVRQAESGYGQTAIITPSDVTRLSRLMGQERDTVIAVLKAAKVRQRVRIAPDAIEQAYTQHPDRYQTEERVRVEYVRLAVDELAKAVEPGKDEIRQAMQDAERAAVPVEERRASHILIKLPPGADKASEQAAMSRIQGLRAQIMAGASFSELARKNSEDPGSAAQGGDLGVVVRGTMVKEFEQALYALGKSGDVSVPVRTQFGLHLIKLTGLRKPPAPKIDRARIEKELRTRKAEQRFVELSEQFHNMIYEQSDSLVPAAKALGLRIETSDWFTRTSPATGILSTPRVREAAFDPEVLDQQRNSPAIEVGPNTLLALRIKAHEPARQLPLQAVRSEIETRLLAEAQKQEAVRLARELGEKLAAGSSLSSLASEYSMEVRGTQHISRKTAGLDQNLLEQVFQAPRPEASKPSHGSAALADGGVAIFNVTRVTEPEHIKADAPEAQAIRRLLESQRGRSYFDHYRAGLRQQAKVKVYKDQL